MNLPNKLTMLRIILIPVFLVLVLVESIPMHYLWALLVYLIACFTDTLDGHIARSRGLVTDFGKLMDPLADKLLVMSLRLIAAGKGVVIAADKWGKIKTISQMIWLNYTLLMLWLFPEAGWAHTVFVVLMGIVVATTVLSGANYMLKNKELYSDR